MVEPATGVGAPATQRRFGDLVESLVDLGYPELFATTSGAWQEALAPLAELAPGGDVDLVHGRLPYVLVIAAPAAPAAAMVAHVRGSGLAPVVALQPVPLERFVPIEALELPAGEAYLLLDVDRGDGSRNVTPDAAQEAFAASGRSPLTIKEGIAVLTHRANLLQPNRCF